MWGRYLAAGCERKQAVAGQKEKEKKKVFRTPDRESERGWQGGSDLLHKGSATGSLH